MADKESSFERLKRQLEAERKMARTHPDRLVDKPIESTTQAFEAPSSQEVPIDFEDHYVAKKVRETEKASLEEQFIQAERKKLEEQHLADVKLKEAQELEAKKKEARRREEEAKLAAQKLEDEKRKLESQKVEKNLASEETTEKPSTTVVKKKSFLRLIRNIIFNNSSKVRLRFIPIWLRVVIVIAISVGAMLLGAMVGYAFLGKGEASEVFTWKTWTHISDLVNKP